MENTVALCKKCQKEKTKYGVWVNGVCPDCVAYQVIEGKQKADCAVAIAHFEACPECRNFIKSKNNI